MQAVRFGVAEITAQETETGLIPVLIDNPYGIELADYSRFKYGDGEISQHLGSLLAAQYLASVDITETELFVTSSAYKCAPPAARSLQDTFVATVSMMTDNQIAVRPFKIDRQNLTNGDYAAMSADERIEVMKRNGLKLPYDLALKDKAVVILDDICVTGAHEASLHALIDPQEPAAIHYGYVLEVSNGSEAPGIEAKINAISVSALEDALHISRQPNFILNARFCRFVLSLNSTEREIFIAQSEPALLTKMSNYVVGDQLKEVEAYKDSAVTFTSDVARALQLDAIIAV